MIEIHDDIIKTTGGHEGIINYGNVDFISSQMRATKGSIKKAAILFYSILTSHPFLDGQKRTAFRSMETFLNVNDKTLISSDEDIWDVVHKISKGEMSFTETVEWLKKNIK
ncbi:MAG: type II toxin-antitoxin system death-on-curing family toxin [Candidatus Aenigmatarchaeota archaeon]